MRGFPWSGSTSVSLNRMGKTRDFFKKIGESKGTFHIKMGIKRDRNCKDLTETEEIKKRW